MWNLGSQSTVGRLAEVMNLGPVGHAAAVSLGGQCVRPRCRHYPCSRLCFALLCCLPVSYRFLGIWLDLWGPNPPSFSVMFLFQVSSCLGHSCVGALSNVSCPCGKMFLLFPSTGLESNPSREQRADAELPCCCVDHGQWCPRTWLLTVWFPSLPRSFLGPLPCAPTPALSPLPFISCPTSS